MRDPYFAGSMLTSAIIALIGAFAAMRKDDWQVFIAVPLIAVSVVCFGKVFEWIQNLVRPTEPSVETRSARSGSMG